MTTLTPVQQKLIESARAEHGGAEAMLLDGKTLIVVRKPTPEEFLEIEDTAHRIECGAVIKDPGIVYRPLLALVCVGRPELEALQDIGPGLELDLRMMALDAAKAGLEITPVEEVPTELTKQHGQVLLFTVNGEQVLLRKLDRFDWMHYRGDANRARGGLDGFMSRHVLAKYAAQQVIEKADDSTGKKERFAALCARFPTLPVQLGFFLTAAAQISSERVRGK